MLHSHVHFSILSSYLDSVFASTCSLIPAQFHNVLCSVEANNCRWQAAHISTVQMQATVNSSLYNTKILVQTYFTH